MPLDQSYTGDSKKLDKQSNESPSKVNDQSDTLRRVSRDRDHSKKEIALITADIGWGSANAAAEGAPQALLDAGLAEKIDAVVIRVPVSPKMSQASPTYEETEQIVATHICQVSDAVERAVREGYFPVVIGGDHTSAIGFHAGLGRAYGALGIMWIDTHPDLNTLETSPSARIHGMVLAILLGRGSDLMLGTSSDCLTKDTQVAMVGTRDIDHGEMDWLNEGKIHCMTMDYVRRHGLHSSLSEAVQTVCQGTKGFGLTIDLDAIDPEDVPFVATPVQGGIRLPELLEELRVLPSHEKMMGLEVTEYTPRSSEDYEAACEVVSSIIKAATDSGNA